MSVSASPVAALHTLCAHAGVHLLAEALLCARATTRAATEPGDGSIQAGCNFAHCRRSPGGYPEDRVPGGVRKSMSYDRGMRRGSDGGSRGSQTNASVGVPGKRTLTEALSVDRDAARRPAAVVGKAETEADHDGLPGGASTAETHVAATVPMAQGGAAKAEAKPGATAGAQPGDKADPAAGVGETHVVPDIGLLEFETDGDTVGGSIAFTGSAGRGGTVDAGDFGTTSTTYPPLTNVKITKGTGAFTVSADFAMKVEWQVLVGTGPSSQVNIASDSDPALTKTNYPTAASDLTPNMSNTGGKPPRTKFWAQDLTEIHEKFHADERVKYGKLGVTGAVAWLTTQTATDEAGVRELLSQARDKIIAYVRSKMVNPGKEERAYADGAPKYKARADAIKKKGDAGGYP